MVDLFLVAAVFAATGAARLIVSGRGRGVPGPVGEVAGSVVVTSDGGVVITAIFDGITLVARLDVMDVGGEHPAYRLTLLGVDPSSTPLLSVSERTAEFDNPATANRKIYDLLLKHGVPLQGPGALTIPCAILQLWQTPDVCKSLIRSSLESGGL
jgi:hypothetical protein